MEFSSYHESKCDYCGKINTLERLGGVLMEGQECICRKYAPVESVCWHCFERFDTRNALFRHLEAEKHHLNPPTICLFCCVDLKHMKTIYGCYVEKCDWKEHANEHFLRCREAKYNSLDAKLAKINLLEAETDLERKRILWQFAAFGLDPNGEY